MRPFFVSHSQLFRLQYFSLYITAVITFVLLISSTKEHKYILYILCFHNYIIGSYFLLEKMSWMLGHTTDICCNVYKTKQLHFNCDHQGVRCFFTNQLHEKSLFIKWCILKSFAPLQVLYTTYLSITFFYMMNIFQNQFCGDEEYVSNYNNQ